MSGYSLFTSRRDARPIPHRLLPAYYPPRGGVSLAHETHVDAKAAAACQPPTPRHIVDLVMLCSKSLLVTWIGKNRTCSTICGQSSPKSLILSSHQRDLFKRSLRFCVTKVTGCPAPPSFGRARLFPSAAKNLGVPSFDRFWESVGIIVLSISSISLAQPAITDPAQLKSRNVENMQNFTIEKLYMTRNIGGTTWSPDGKQIAFVSNISGRNNIWLVPSTGGWPSQLTISQQRQVQPTWSPDGNWIAYASDYDGNEQWDIFLVSPKTGEVVNLTTTKEISEESPVWSPDSKQLVYLAKAKSGSSHEVELIDVYSRRVKHLTQNTPKDRTNAGPVFSRDGKFLVYSVADAGFKDADIYILDLGTGKATNLTPHQGEQTFFAADISPDGKTTLVTSNAHNGYDNVGLLEIATQK